MIAETANWPDVGIYAISAILVLGFLYFVYRMATD